MPNIDDPRLKLPQYDFLQPVITVHENPWFSVKNRGGYFTFEDNTPQVIILPIVDNKSFVMVEIQRPVIADNTMELPAGGTNKNETPIFAAARELYEETGILVSDLQRFQILPPLVYMVRNPILPYIFQVHITKQEYDLKSDHDGEILSVGCFEFGEVLAKILSGEILIGLQIAIITRYLMNNAVHSFYLLK